ncbi:hypothetical protein AVEN_151415-1 [Araneus ventricosus]|uniref:Uncharacterized protein n=1 Tax=Araneus ventricosus TaxID=182803 RepID=A0A4Y2CCB2_ARAVE|nr:hypothetical protein AVEN_151415-1 [Araneus ventricosus]
MHGKGVTKRTLTSVWKEELSNLILRSLRQYSVEPIVNKIVSLAKIRGLEVDSNYIDERVEEHNQELTILDLMCRILAKL